MSPNRRIFLNIIATYRRSLYALVLVMLSVCVNAAVKEAPPAWRNCIDKAAAEEAMQAYTSNVIRCYWAGEDERVANLMPANLTFQFAVIGDSDVTNRVQKILEETAGAINPDVRKALESQGMLNSTLQWLVRLCRPAITNFAQYATAQAHPAVFCERDFDAAKLKYAAGRLGCENIPVPVEVKFGYDDAATPLGKAEPVAGYPDILPEETFTLPFGAAMILRAPERRRRLRLSASAWQPDGRPVEFVWKTSSWAWIAPWEGKGLKTLANGYATVAFGTASIGRRLDIMVFAKYGNGLYGPPAVVSVYNLPTIRREYARRGVRRMSYFMHSPEVLYDISPVWIPHEWRDEFERDEKGRTMSYVRTYPRSRRRETFSAVGELVHSMSSYGYPLLTSKVEYFVSPETGLLDFRSVGEKISYRAGAAPYRRSGE